MYQHKYKLILVNIFLKGLLFLGLIISLNSRIEAQDSVSLVDCIKKAREYFPLYSDKQRYDVNRDLKIKNISTLWLPQLSLNAQATYQSEATKVDVPIPNVDIPSASLDQYKVTLDVNQVLFDGGSVKAQKKLANASVDAELQQNETDIYKVNEQVINIYFNTLLLQVTRQMYTNTLDDLNSKENKISSGVRNGILMQSDLDNLKVEILKTQQLLTELDFSWQNNLRILGDLTGDSSIIKSKLIVPELTYINSDSVNRPELKLFEFQKNVLEGSKSISSSQRIPKLYAFSQLGYGRPGLNMLKDEFQTFYIVGLKLQWNIWDWKKASREKSMYNVQQEMVDSKRESYLRNINISSNNELTKIKQIESALAADEEIYSLRKRITQQTEKRLEQGMITMTDYLTDYNAEIKAGLQLETRKIQLIYNKANYLFIRGLL
jgi:outer membrane protein TolC